MHLPQAQAAYLEGACQTDVRLRSRVEALLKSHRQDSFLEIPAVGEPPTAFGQTPISETAGTTIGRYTLLQVIGEGGFGAVYLAEQREPVRRQVALKIIKLGMDSQQVVARFKRLASTPRRRKIKR
jgi:serine/threonine protein kinase